MRKYRKPYRIKKKRSIFHNRFFWLGILILIVFGGIFYLICFSSFFQIKEIKISGNSQLEIEDFQRDKQKVSIEGIRELIEKEIEKKILIFSTKSIFLTNLNKINETIIEKFPQIAQANLNRKFPDILIAQIEERKPIAIFYQNENYFFIDSEGIIFDPVRNNISNGAELESEFLKIENLIPKEDLELGEKVIEKERLNQILEIESKLKENLRISLTEVSIISEERLNAKTAEGWEIYLNPQGDIDWQLTKLSLVLKERIPPEKRRNVEYIDLRFEKVYIFPETYQQ